VRNWVHYISRLEFRESKEIHAMNWSICKVGPRDGVFA